MHIGIFAFFCYILFGIFQIGSGLPLEFERTNEISNEKKKIDQNGQKCILIHFSPGERLELSTTMMQGTQESREKCFQIKPPESKSYCIMLEIDSRIQRSHAICKRKNGIEFWPKKKALEKIPCKDEHTNFVIAPNGETLEVKIFGHDIEDPVSYGQLSAVEVDERPKIRKRRETDETDGGAVGGGVGGGVGFIIFLCIIFWCCSGGDSYDHVQVIHVNSNWNNSNEQPSGDSRISIIEDSVGQGEKEVPPPYETPLPGEVGLFDPPEYETNKEGQ